jgi:hypothetical protein
MTRSSLIISELSAELVAISLGFFLDVCGNFGKGLRKMPNLSKDRAENGNRQY